ncbi:hypothetical protein V8Z80_00055 [Orrella sp. JC864]|uniref:hypothetical protein n=1 Tax=Orrella sp. JC864 TaxID=3120298 RepID=UPI003009363C
MRTVSVIDDSGLLAVLDVAGYRPYVSGDWDHAGLVAHLRAQTQAGRIFAWDCGDGGGSYPVSLRQGISASKGFREAGSVLAVRSGLVHVVSYDSLTMAAQFADAALPAAHEQDQCLALAPGSYRVRVVQTYDPAALDRPRAGLPAFVIEFEAGSGRPADGVAWHLG